MIFKTFLYTEPLENYTRFLSSDWRTLSRVLTNEACSSIARTWRSSPSSAVLFLSVNLSLKVLTKSNRLNPSVYVVSSGSILSGTKATFLLINIAKVFNHYQREKDGSGRDSTANTWILLAALMDTVV